MVSQILMLLALTATTPTTAPATPPAGSSGGARAEARVSATIQRGVTLRAELVASEFSVLPAVSRAPRNCGAPDGQGPACRLIVYDLP